MISPHHFHLTNGVPRIPLGEMDVNLQMVKDGMAWHYKFYDKTSSYADAEMQAREKKIG